MAHVQPRDMQSRHVLASLHPKVATNTGAGSPRHSAIDRATFVVTRPGIRSHSPVAVLKAHWEMPIDWATQAAQSPLCAAQPAAGGPRLPDHGTASHARTRVISSSWRHVTQAPNESPVRVLPKLVTRMTSSPEKSGPPESPLQV